ncbi:MAG: hypothetical protein HYZ28_25920 [Myxococcales bacterium]|nr:hypothetical protein [Myxococcales bacterium]
MERDQLFAYLSSLLAHLPLLIAYGVAVSLAVARWHRHPSVSALVVIATAVLLLEALVGRYLGMWLPVRMHQEGRSAAEVGLMLGAYSFGMSVVAAGCWGMLIAAIFGWRSSSVNDPR